MEVAIKRTSVFQLVDLLTRLLRAPMVDQTGLNGKYDISVNMEEDSGQSDPNRYDFDDFDRTIGKP